MVVLVADDGLVAVEAAWLVLTGALVTSIATGDVSEDVPTADVEKDVDVLATVEVELEACVSLTLDASGRTNVQNNQCSHLFHLQDAFSYVLQPMKWTVV